MTDDAVALMHLAHQLHRNLERRLQSDFAHPKPPEMQIVALWQVRERPGITVRELADELQLRPNNASALVTAMVTANLLRREPDERDRRVVRLHATEQARERMDRVQELFTGYLLNALGQLTEEQQSAVRTALPALAALSVHVRRDAH
ncbi:MarR family transcriptional regulator [Actinoplanes sp. OR16]|uniref:MarR family winged helix-turn-helix transcriptional regulator n=1 Tax=Actinoplanes sp. OR16 TaxID=946334 RepID=UPI000F6DDFB5|nr:MarR family transcriptional regulator [Actinoplanes sp. OR16]BBH68149.1 MarR family transcriptional regulator [Actinoplanes sp. OR16]